MECRQVSWLPVACSPLSIVTHAVRAATASVFTANTTSRSLKILRPRDERADHAAEHFGRPEVLPVARDLTEKLPSPSNDQIASPQPQNVLQFQVRRACFIEEVAAPRFERAELAAEHRLADEPVVAAMAVELLLGAVVDAGNAHRGGEKRECRDDSLCVPLSVALVMCEARLVPALAHLIVVVEGRHDLVPEPRVRLLAHEL